MDRHDSPAVSLLRGWSGLSRGLFRLSGARYGNIGPLEPHGPERRDIAKLWRRITRRRGLAAAIAFSSESLPRT